MLGTVNATAFKGDGANITAINADSIATGTINNDRISLTTTKLYGNFNTTNFAIIDDKIDLEPNYSFTITGYDSQTLHAPSAERRLKGKISNYDDRFGVYKILSTETSKTDKGEKKIHDSLKEKRKPLENLSHQTRACLCATRIFLETQSSTT